MPIVIPYVKQTWVDGSSDASAARLGVIEEGVLDVSQAPSVRVTHNATQTASTGTALALAFNTERFDQAAGAASTMHDTSTNNSRLTAIYAGVYQIFGNIEFASNATGIRILSIRLNGTTTIAEQAAINLTANTLQLNVACIYSMAVNDYVELLATQNSGGNLAINSTAQKSPEFGMVRVG